MTKSKENRFWEKVDIKNSEDCWEWLGAKVRGNYGIVNLGDKNIGAHRLSFWLHTRFNPGKLDVLHKCDNPSCVNPNHLFLGNDIINAKDKMKKNRQVKGEDHINSKLIDLQVKEMRKKYGTGKYSMRDLAKIFNVGYTTVNSAVNKKSWRHI